MCRKHINHHPTCLGHTFDSADTAKFSCAKADGRSSLHACAKQTFGAFMADLSMQMLSKSVPQGPLLKGNSGVRALKAANLANPARHAARAVRDARQLGV